MQIRIHISFDNFDCQKEKERYQFTKNTHVGNIKTSLYVVRGLHSNCYVAFKERTKQLSIIEDTLSACRIPP
jgi:hypothetical protein